MIYTSKDTRNIKLRRLYGTRLDSYVIKLVNNLTLASFVIDATDSGTSGYYVFNLRWPADMIDGEYTYSVIGGGDVLSTGVMWFGDMIDADVVYNTTINDIVYDPDREPEPEEDRMFLLDDGSGIVMDNGLILGY